MELSLFLDEEKLDKVDVLYWLHHADKQGKRLAQEKNLLLKIREVVCDWLGQKPPPPSQEYKLRSPLYLGGMTREAEFEKANPEVVYVLHNTQANGLGEAMPKGTIRFFENDKSGQMQFIGESNLSQLAIGEKAELSLGTTSDIYAHGKTTVGTKISDDISEVSAEITFNNAKSEAVEVEFTQNFSGISWDMISESIKSEKKNISTAVWKVSVPANGSETLRFKVRLNKKA